MSDREKPQPNCAHGYLRCPHCDEGKQSQGGREFSGFEVNYDGTRVVCPCCGVSEAVHELDRKIDEKTGLSKAWPWYHGRDYHGAEPGLWVGSQIREWDAIQVMKEIVRRMEQFFERGYRRNGERALFQDVQEQLMLREAKLAGDMMANAMRFPRYESVLLGRLCAFMWLSYRWRRSNGPRRNRERPDEVGDPIEDWSLFHEFTGANRRIIHRIHGKHKSEKLRRMERDERVANSVREQVRADFEEQLKEAKQDAAVARAELADLQAMWAKVDPLVKLGKLS